jgi:Cu-Zn family superoxide dismutase
MRRDLSFTVGALGLLGLAACGQSASPDGDADPSGAANITSETAASEDALAYGARARARLFGPDGERIGDVIAWQGRDGVLIEIAARALPLGAHGVHIHSVGACNDVGVYTASGGHLGKGDGPHGFLHPDGAHRGDLPNMHVTADGTTRAEFFSPLISVSDLTDTDGAALIIHAARDDWQTQPIGGAGARIACARFRPKT